MRRLPVPFPLSFCLFAKAHPFGAGGAVFGPVGLRHKYCATLGAAFHLAPVFGDLGVQGRVQREDGGPKPPAQQRIGNALHTNAFFPIVQQGAVVVTIITALMRQSPGLAVLAVIHSRYVHRSCVHSFPSVVRRMLSTFCLMMPYSCIWRLASAYCRCSWSFCSANSLYSSFRA